MPRPFVPLTVAQFAQLLRGFNFTRTVNAVHVHHTWRPNHSQDEGLASIESMYVYHTQTNGWSDIAQHVTIDRHGTIWTGRGWNRIPASATGFNTGAFMFEMIGDFDTGKDPFSGAQKNAAYRVTALVLSRFNLGRNDIRFHREFTDQKTCPGNALNLNAFRDAVMNVSDKELAFETGTSPFAGNASNAESAAAAESAKQALISFLESDSSEVSKEEANAELECSPAPNE